MNIMTMQLLALGVALHLRSDPDAHNPDEAPPAHGHPFESHEEGAQHHYEQAVRENTHGVDLENPQDCPPDAVKTCHKLWHKKLEGCEEVWQEKPHWFPMCGSPHYTDSTGTLRDCAVGICSEAYQAVVDQKQEARDACAQFDGNDKRVAGCEQCSLNFPDNVVPCMECEAQCMKETCNGVGAETCLHNGDVYTCHESCMDRYLRRLCQSFEGQPRVHKSCELCEGSYPDHVLECIQCGKKCMKKVPACDDPDSADCVTSEKMVECHTPCMEEFMSHMESHLSDAAAKQGDDHYSGGEMAEEEVESLCGIYLPGEQAACAMCEANHKTEINDCMECEKGCMVDNPCAEEDESCEPHSTDAFFKCHHGCMKEHEEKHCTQLMGKEPSKVEMSTCRACTAIFPNAVLPCLTCGTTCMRDTCKTPGSGKCLRNKDMRKCHDSCMSGEPLALAAAAPPTREAAVQVARRSTREALRERAAARKPHSPLLIGIAKLRAARRA